MWPQVFTYLYHLTASRPLIKPGQRQGESIPQVMSGTDLSGNVHQGRPDERRAAVYQMQITPQPFVHSMVIISFL